LNNLRVLLYVPVLPLQFCCNFQLPGRICQIALIRDVVPAENRIGFVARNSARNISRYSRANQVSHGCAPKKALVSGIDKDSGD